MIIPTDLQLLSLLDQRLLIEDKTNEYIYISDMPNRFGFGYNSFLIGVAEGIFLPNSYLYIIYRDAAGHNIPVTVTQYLLNRLIRCYFYIDLQYSVGFGKFMVCGTVDKYIDGDAITEDWKSRINIKYTSNIYLNPYLKTPSVLRFKTVPNINLYVNEKELFDYKITKSTEIFSISSVTIDRPYTDYICVSLDTSSMTKSVYYEKYLNYKYTDTISNVTNSNLIFSGSVSSSVLSNIGLFNGNIIVKLPDNAHINFDTANIVINEGILDLGSVVLSQINKLIAYNIDEFKLNNNAFRSAKDSLGTYFIYLLNISPDINIASIDITDSNSRVTPIQYISTIDYALKFSSQTTFFSGVFSAILGELYSLNLLLTETNSALYGSYKNPLIKSTDKFLLLELATNKVYAGYSITHSNDPFSCTTSGLTTLNNCYFTNGRILNIAGQPLTTFNYISGQLYSKHIITRQELGYSRSYFSGSLRGSGIIVVRTSGSTLLDESSTIVTYDKDEIIELLNTFIFRGLGYNSSIDILYFSGSIYSSSYTNTLTKLRLIYSGLRFKKMLIESSNCGFEFKNLLVLEVSPAKGFTTYDTFSIAINNPSSSSSIKVISLTPLSIYLSTNKIINATGYFNLTDTVKNCIFNGYHQLATGNYEIQKYELVSAQLTKLYLSIFNTKLVEIKDNDYSKLYIPIASTVYKNYSSTDIQSLIYNTLKGSNSAPLIEITYDFRNELTEPEYIANSLVLPMYVVISDVDIYSGHFNSVLVLYNDDLSKNVYQHLSLILFDKYPTFPLTKSIDLPALGFSNLSTNLLFKFLDPLGRPCPEDFFYTIYDVKIDASALLNLQKTYNVSYLGGSTVGGSVTSVNNLTGDVYLTALNIPFNNIVLPNVDLALNYLLVNGGGSGSGGSALLLHFSTSVFEYLIGSTRSDSTAVTFSWTYSPTALHPTAQYYELYYSLYPSLTDWVKISSGSIPIDTYSILIDSEVSTSLKLQVNYMDSLNESHTNTAYCYFRNNIFIGNSVYSLNYLTLLPSLLNIYLAGDYKTCYSGIVTDSMYIYMGFPSYMNVRLPSFVINDISGGFSSSSVFAYTNLYDFSENYILYRSFNNNIGLIFLSVKDPIDCLNSVTYSSLIVGGLELPDHNELSGLQGGSETERYHLTSYLYTNKLHLIFVSSLDPDPTSGSVGDLWIKI